MMVTLYPFGSYRRLTNHHKNPARFTAPHTSQIIARSLFERTGLFPVRRSARKVNIENKLWLEWSYENPKAKANRKEQRNRYYDEKSVARG